MPDRRPTPRRTGIVSLVAGGLLFLVLGVVAYSSRESHPRTGPTQASHSDNAVDVLIDAPEVFPAVLALIRAARTEVVLSVYLLGGIAAAPGDPAGIGREIVDALVERQTAGVSVRVLNTPFRTVPDPRPPAEVFATDLWFHPVFTYAKAQGLTILRPAVSKGAIDHTKYLVVDGTDAIFGGMNLADAAADNHDVMVVVAGPVAGALRLAFDNQWKLALEAQPSAGSATPSHSPAPATIVQLVAARNARVAAGSEHCDVALYANTLTSHPIGPAIAEGLDALQEGDRLNVGMLLLTDASMAKRVIGAHRRKVDVRAMLDPGRAIYGVNCNGSNNAASAGQFDKAGVPIRLFSASPGAALHMKLFVATPATGDASFGVGSANWSRSDLERNWEMFGMFRGCRRAAARLRALLDDDWETRSAPLTAEQRTCYASTSCRAELSRACDVTMKHSWLAKQK